MMHTAIPTTFVFLLTLLGGVLGHGGHENHAPTTSGYNMGLTAILATISGEAVTFQVPRFRPVSSLSDLPTSAGDAHVKHPEDDDQGSATLSTTSATASAASFSPPDSSTAGPSITGPAVTATATRTSTIVVATRTITVPRYRKQNSTWANVTSNGTSPALLPTALFVAGYWQGHGNASLVTAPLISDVPPSNKTVLPTESTSTPTPPSSITVPSTIPTTASANGRMLYRNSTWVTAKVRATTTSAHNISASASASASVAFTPPFPVSPVRVVTLSEYPPRPGFTDFATGDKRLAEGDDEPKPRLKRGLKGIRNGLGGLSDGFRGGGGVGDAEQAPDPNMILSSKTNRDALFIGAMTIISASKSSSMHGIKSFVSDYSTVRLAYDNPYSKAIRTAPIAGSTSLSTRVTSTNNVLRSVDIGSQLSLQISPTHVSSPTTATTTKSSGGVVPIKSAALVVLAACVFACFLI